MIVVFRKINQGFQAYQLNTGIRHPSDRLEKRSIGSEPLTHNGPYWYGSISVGTPPKAFTGEYLSYHSLRCTVWSELNNSQCNSTRGAAT